MLTSLRRWRTAAAMLRHAALPVAAASALGGCYVQSPLTSLPTPGTEIVVELNDEGRVGMASQVGPSVTSIEGLLDSASTDSAFTLRVSGVSIINGAFAKWAGEPVTVRPAFVQSLAERRLSKGRTAVLAGGLAVAATVFVATRGLGVLGGGGSPAPSPGGGGTSNGRWVHP